MLDTVSRNYIQANFQNNCIHILNMKPNLLEL